jgi:hypothetical protein
MQNRMIAAPPTAPIAGTASAAAFFGYRRTET